MKSPIYFSHPYIVLICTVKAGCQEVNLIIASISISNPTEAIYSNNTNHLQKQRSKHLVTNYNE